MKSGELVAAKYRLLRPLGRGGMAEVWAAAHVVTQREFAIKLILPSLAGNDEAVERFFQEAKAAGRVRHPSIVDVYDVGRAPEGRPYLVMELLHGESLEACIARHGKLGAQRTSILIAQVARALHLAHRAGVVHRDLSAANVFLAISPEGGEPVPKILDFGVSKILTPGLEGQVRTGNGAVLGSPAYMSPEQARGAENVDARTDVWALGVLAYECVSGRVPFMASNYNALMLAIIATAHGRASELAPGLDPELETAIESCLIKDRDARTQSALDLAEQLEAVARRLERSGMRASMPQRRASDRKRLAPERAHVAPLPRAARLPAGAFPLGIRLWQFLTQRAPRSGLMMGGTIAGATLGLFIGVAIATTRPSEAKSDRLQPALASARPAPHRAPAARVLPASPERGQARSEPAPSLVKATARALGIGKKPSRRTSARPAKPSATALALAPRKNPY